MIAAACIITVAVSKYSCPTLDLEKSLRNVKRKKGNGRDYLKLQAVHK